MSIYVHRDGTEYGPYSREQIQEYLRDGNFEPNDWARTEELEDWVPLGELVHPATPEPEPEPELKPEPANVQDEPVAPTVKGGLPRAAWGGIAGAVVLALGVGAWFLFFKPKDKPAPGPGAGKGTNHLAGHTTNDNGGATKNTIVVPPAPTNLKPIPASAKYVPANATSVISLRIKKLIDHTGSLASLTGHSSYREMVEYLDLHGDLLDMVLKDPGNHGLDLTQPAHFFIQKTDDQGPSGRTVGLVAALNDANAFGQDALPDWFNALLPGQGDQAREKMKDQDGAHIYGEDSKPFALGYDDKAVIILFAERPSPNLKFEIANFFGDQDGLAGNKAGLLFRDLLTRLDDIGYWRKSGDGVGGESFAPPVVGALAPLDTEWAINFKFTRGLVVADAILRHDPKLLATWGNPEANLNPKLLELVPNQPMVVMAVSAYMPALRDLVLRQIMPRHENPGVNRHSKAFKKQMGIALKDALAIPHGGIVVALTDVGIKLDNNNQVHPEFRTVLGLDLSLTNQLNQMLTTVKTNGIGNELAAQGIRHKIHDNRLILGTGPHTTTVSNGTDVNPLPAQGDLHATLRTNHLAIVVDLKKTEQLIRSRTALFRDHPSARILGDMRLNLWNHLALTARASEGRVDFYLRLQTANPDLSGFRTLLDSHKDNVQFIRNKGHEIACRNNLDRISVAMRLWATANNKPPTAAVDMADLLPFLQNIMPLCHSGGKYFLTTLDQPCNCSKHSQKTSPAPVSAEK